MRVLSSLLNQRDNDSREKTARGAAGQSLVEFSMVVIFLVLVMVGVMDFARFFFTYGTLANAAREGARYGIIFPGNRHAGDSPDPDNIFYRTKSAIGLMGDALKKPYGNAGDKPVYIEILYPDNCNTPGCRISVKVTGVFKTWTPLIPEVPVVAQATMYIE